MRLTVFCFAFLFLAGCASLPSNPREPASISNPPFTLNDQCRDFIRGLAPGYKYGWVASTVTPEKNDNVLYVFYYHRPAPGKTPIMIFNGGPGFESHRIYRQLEFDQDASLETPWFVFMDQRGTGCSTRYPDTKNAKEYLYWGTEGIVRDAEAVRAVLKIPQWNIFGQSYGSFIVHRYLQTHPEAISTAVGHGGSPLEGYSEYNRLRYEQQLFVIQKYLKKYPEDVELVKNIVRRQRCLEGGEVCGGYAVRLLSSSGMGFSDSWQFVHDQLRKLNMSKIPRTHYEDADAEDETDRMNDINFWLNAELNGSYSVVNCNKVRRQALTTLGAPELFAFSECWGKNGSEGRDGLSEASYKEAMASLGLPILSTKAIRENLEKYPGIKFYLFSSEMDFYTPPAIVSRAAGEMGPRVKYEKIRYAGHEAYIYAPVMRILLPGLDGFLKENGQ